MEEHFPNSNAGPVLLFDGECGLCHRVVRGLLKCDRRERLRFAPLHGAAAQVWLRERGLPTTDFTKGFDLQPYVRIELTDEGQAGGLLGIRY